MGDKASENIEIFKSRNILVKHLKNQNYDVSEYENITFNDISIMAEHEQLDMLVEKENKKCYVKYYLPKNIPRLNIIREYIDDLFVNEEILSVNDDLIIIINDDPNDTLIKGLKDLWEENRYYLRIINRKRLQFDILEHVFVPEHIILTKEEKNKLYIDKNINKDKELPEISRFDPVSLVIGIRPGEVCKITRTSKTAIISHYYRFCIQ